MKKTGMVIIKYTVKRKIKGKMKNGSIVIQSCRTNVDVVSNKSAQLIFLKTFFHDPVQQRWGYKNWLIFFKKSYFTNKSVFWQITLKNVNFWL